MSKPPDYEDWPPRARASYLLLEKERREIIELVASEVGYEYASDACPGNERVPVELLALVAMALGADE